MKLSPLEWIALGGLGIVIFIAYQRGLFSKNVQNQINPQQATGQANQLSPAQIENIVNNLVTATEQNAALFTPDPLYNAMMQLNALNDADFVAVFNTYARKNANAEYKNLSAYLQSEYITWFTDTWNLRDTIVKRATKFSL